MAQDSQTIAKKKNSSENFFPSISLLSFLAQLAWWDICISMDHNIPELKWQLEPWHSIELRVYSNIIGAPISWSSTCSGSGDCGPSSSSVGSVFALNACRHVDQYMGWQGCVVLTAFELDERMQRSRVSDWQGINRLQNLSELLLILMSPTVFYVQQEEKRPDDKTLHVLFIRCLNMLLFYIISPLWPLLLEMQFINAKIHGLLENHLCLVTFKSLRGFL